MASTLIHRTELTSNVAIEIHAKEGSGLTVNILLLGSDHLRPTQTRSANVTVDEARFLIDRFTHHRIGEVSFFDPPTK